LAAVGEGSFYRVESGRRQQFGVDGAYHDIVRPDGVLRLADVKLAGKPVARNSSASLWDLGDGVLCLEFHTKMNALDEGVIRMVQTAMGRIDGRSFKALVLHNEAENFSVGANIGVVLFAANVAAWPLIEASV